VGSDKWPKTLVVISHYNARSEDPLDILLRQLQRIPAGAPFDVRVVVNHVRDFPLRLDGKYANVQVCYRENVGMNIGAWDHGWKLEPRYDAYVFLQDECLILRSHWLRAYLRRATRGRGRVVGEAMIRTNQPWSEWSSDVEPSSGWHVPFLMKFFAENSVEPQANATHLQSLILCATRRALEATGGFIVGRDYQESVASEIAFSQKAVSRGFPIEQVSLLPFEYIIHPQWMDCRWRDRTPGRWIRAMYHRHVPETLRGLVQRLRSTRKIARVSTIP
jgi:hypothetical protein